MTETTRIGVVGCGFFARNHAHAWKDLEAHGAKLVGFCDVEIGNAQAFAKEFGGAAYADMADMLASEAIDIVDIVTQVASHRPLVELALNAGVATIVQKPFGQTLEDCKAMTELSESLGVPLAVHENFRFQGPSRQIKALIASGKIGTPNWGRIAFRTGYDIFAGQPYLRDEERFVITDLGSHVLDLARYFFGEVDRLTAEVQTRLKSVRGEDTATMLLRHATGAVSVVECTYASLQEPDPFPATLIEIEGTAGALRLEGDLTLHVSSSDGLTALDADVPVRTWAERPWHVVQDSVFRTCEQILESVRSGQPAETSATDNLKTFALCEAAYRSAGGAGFASPIVH